MFYSILDFVSVADIYSKDSLFVIIIHKRQAFLPEFALKYVNIGFCSLFGMSMAIFAIHFVYRFLIVTGNSFLRKKHFEKVISLIGFTIVVGFAWSGSITEYLAPRQMNLSEIDYIGAHFHQIDENGKEFINWKSMSAIGLMTVIILISFSTVFYCGFGIYTRMGEMSSIQSFDIKNLQSQLFWALVFQTLIPVFLMHIPASIGFITSMCNRTNLILGQVTAISIFMYPALDPLPNFFIIKSFRTTIFGFFNCEKRNIACLNCLQNSN